MRYLALFFGVLLVIGVVWLATRKPPSITDELAKLTPADQKALAALLSESGLTAADLRPVVPGVLQHHPRAVAVQDGRIVELRLSDAPLRRLDALAALTGLRALWLSGNQLASLHGMGALPALKRLDLGNNQLRDVGELSAHPTLETLRLSHNALQSVAGLRDLPRLKELVLDHNQLTSLAGLGGLPALTELDVSDNRISDLSPLTALPALTAIQASHNPLGPLPSPTPTQWRVKSDGAAPAKVAATADSAPTAARGNRPANWVAQTPPTVGKATPASVSGQVQADAFSCQGTIGVLHGAVRIDNIPGANNAGGVGSTLELTVDKGRVRAYLQYVAESDSFLKTTDGYLFAEAQPGKPGKVKGLLGTLGRGYGYAKAFNFVVESLDGDAQGITYRIYR